MDEDNEIPFEIPRIRVTSSTSWIQGEVVKRNVDHRMKVGSDIIVVNFFVFYKNDDDTSNHVFNLSNYNKDESPESVHFTWVLLQETRKRHETEKRRETVEEIVTLELCGVENTVKIILLHT